MGDRLRVLVVDDQPHWRTFLKEEVQRSGLASEIKEATDGDIALHILENWRCEILVTDFSMPNLDGIALATEVRTRWPQMKIIMVTGSCAEATMSMNWKPEDFVHQLVHKAEFDATRALKELGF